MFGNKFEQRWYDFSKNECEKSKDFLISCLKEIPGESS